MVVIFIEKIYNQNRLLGFDSMTDEYVLTIIRDANLDWQLHPSGGFVAIMNGVIIHATSNFLKISKDFKSVKFPKPQRTILEQSTQLEELIKGICKKAANKCLEHDTKEYQKNLRKELLKQLTGLNT